MKKLVLLSILLCPTFITHAQNSINPADPQAHIFTHLNETGVMSSAPNPERNTTRAEALAIALRAGGIVIPTDFGGVTHFSDVNPNEWFAPVVERAVATKIISGERELFRPNAPVTKAEFLAFLFRSTQVNLRPYFTKLNSVALDVPEDSWFAPYFAYAKKFQIAHLPPDQFYRPEKVLSRREVAMMTFRELRIFHGNNTTKIFVELQAEIEQFITLMRAGEPDKAESHLQKIIFLTESLTLAQNNEDAVAASAISRALEHFSDSLRALKFQNNLFALESLHLAAKQTKRALDKSPSFASFAEDLLTLIDETLVSFSSSKFSKYTQR
ncbi:S-layer homology domain-containing protein [Candidatus Gracilibacteria bacterium]|nr:S-layer homology domain-containing protein [Candidatus Gracilibacteria bacterium]